MRTHLYMRCYLHVIWSTYSNWIPPKANPAPWELSTGSLVAKLKGMSKIKVNGYGGFYLFGLATVFTLWVKDIQALMKSNKPHTLGSATLYIYLKRGCCCHKSEGGQAACPLIQAANVADSMEWIHQQLLVTYLESPLPCSQSNTEYQLAAQILFRGGGGSVSTVQPGWLRNPPCKINTCLELICRVPQ